MCMTNLKNNHFCTIKCVSTKFNCGPGSSVGITTELRAGRSGIESRWERDFPPIHGLRTVRSRIECRWGRDFPPIHGLRTGRSGIESRWGRDFPPVQTGLGAHEASCKMGTGSFLGVKCGRGVLLNTHPLLVPRSWKSRAIPLPTLCAKPGL